MRLKFEWISQTRSGFVEVDCPNVYAALVVYEGLEATREGCQISVCFWDRAQATYTVDGDDHLRELVGREFRGLGLPLGGGFEVAVRDEAVQEHLRRLADERWRALRLRHNQAFMSRGPGTEWQRYKNDFAAEFEEIAALRRFLGLKEG